MKGIVYFIVLCMCCACRYGNTAVEEALMLAGKNRGELEAVLEYYREDSLKTKAAEFLIGNMPGHYSFADTVSVNRYYDAVDAVLDSLSGRPMEEVFLSVCHSAWTTLIMVKWRMWKSLRRIT